MGLHFMHDLRFYLNLHNTFHTTCKCISKYLHVVYLVLAVS